MHDLNARVFRGYLDGMLTDLLKNGYMGRRIANTHVIEFQKRGLPHAHILVMLHPEDKPTSMTTSGEDLNDYVCAELPPQDGPLRQAVLQHMLHSQCGPGSGQPCMDDEDKYCKKNFPKEFAAETVWDESSSYPVYRRRSPEEGGRRCPVQEQNGGQSVGGPVQPLLPFEVQLPHQCGTLQHGPSMQVSLQVQVRLNRKMLEMLA